MSRTALELLQHRMIRMLRAVCLVTLSLLAVVGCRDSSVDSSASGDAGESRNAEHDGFQSDQLLSIHPASTSVETCSNRLGMRFSLIPAGVFWMGIERGELNEPGSDAEQPRHHVHITQPFWMGQHEVMLGQFRRFVDATGYRTDAERTGEGCNGLVLPQGEVQRRTEWIWSNPGFPQTESHPVVCVSWHDAQEFCQWLSREERRTCRLPTEAEWEYACRAGTWTTFSTGMRNESLEGAANSGDLTLRALFPSAGRSAPWKDGYSFTAPVGQFAGNAWSLFDVHGNVGEWCQDWYDGQYYSRSPTNDPSGPETPQQWHVVRGGSWYNTPVSCRSSGRHDGVPTAASTTNGFRVVMEVEDVAR